MMETTVGAAKVDTMPVRARLEGASLRAVILCALVIALDGFDAQSIAYVAPSITAAWGLKPAALGTVFSSGLLGLTIGALLLSPAADRFGRVGGEPEDVARVSDRTHGLPGEQELAILGDLVLSFLGGH